MKECESIKCCKIHDGSYGSGRFCSKKCSHTRHLSAEIRAKIGKSLKGRRRSINIDSEAAKVRSEKISKRWLLKYLATPFENLGMENRRRRVFEEQNYTCYECGLSEWRSFQINLELEHVNGNNEDNSRSNLIGLCPNCHSNTHTWRGRNKPSRNGKIIVTDAELMQCVMTTKNIRQALLQAGIAAKGSNYKRVKEVCLKYNISFLDGAVTQLVE